MIFLKYNSKRVTRRKFYENEISCRYYLSNCSCKLYGGNIVFLKRNDNFDTGKCDKYAYKIVSQVITLGNWCVNNRLYFKLFSVFFLILLFECNHVIGMSYSYLKNRMIWCFNSNNPFLLLAQKIIQTAMIKISVEIWQPLRHSCLVNKFNAAFSEN